MLHMLDTDIASYAIRGRASIKAKLSEMPQDDVCISVMTRAEMNYGLKKVPAESRLHLGVKAFLKVVRILPWDSEAADYYAEIRHQLEASRQQIGEIDMMIAAHSLSANAALVTNNARHFNRIRAPLNIVTWLAE